LYGRYSYGVLYVGGTAYARLLLTDCLSVACSQQKMLYCRQIPYQIYILLDYHTLLGTPLYDNAVPSLFTFTDAGSRNVRHPSSICAIYLKLC